MEEAGENVEKSGQITGKKDDFIALLPENNTYFIVSFEQSKHVNDDYTVTFRIKDVVDENSGKTWLSQFMESSKMTYRLDRSYPLSGRKNIWKADFRCHHNTRNSKTVGKLKNTECRSTLTITVKRVLLNSRSSDPYIKEWPTIVVIKMCHNHPLDDSATLQYRSVGTDIENKFLEMFKNGHTPMSALKAHKVDLMLEYGDKYNAVSQDRAQCPDPGYCYRLYYKKIGRHIRVDNAKLKKPRSGGSSATNQRVKHKSCDAPPKKNDAPPKKKRKRSYKNDNSKRTEEVKVSNLVTEKGPNLPVIAQQLHNTNLDELQVAVQALEQGNACDDLQTIRFIQSQPLMPQMFDPLHNPDYPSCSQSGWTPECSVGLETRTIQMFPGDAMSQSATHSMHTEMLTSSSSFVSSGQSNQNLNCVNSESSKSSPTCPSSASKQMDSELKSNDVLSAVMQAAQLQPSLPQIASQEPPRCLSMPEQQSPNPVNSVSPNLLAHVQHGAPSFNQSHVIEPHLGCTDQDQSVPSELSQSQVLPSRLSSTEHANQGHLTPISSQFSQPPQQDTLQMNTQNVEEQVSEAATHPVITNVVSLSSPENPLNIHSDILQKLSQHSQISNFTDLDSGHTSQSQHHVELPVVYHTDAPSLPEGNALQTVQFIVDDTVSEVFPQEEVVVAAQPEPEEIELGLDDWVDQFVHTLKHKYYTMDLFRSAFERLRKNVDENIKTDLALSSALSNFAKLPPKAKKSMNVVYPDDTDLAKTTPKRRPCRCRRFLSPKRQVGSSGWRTNRNRFCMWRSKFGRRLQKKCVCTCMNEAPGLQEILDTFGTEESEQQREREKETEQQREKETEEQREREKESAEALLEMEARVVVKTVPEETTRNDNVPVPVVLVKNLFKTDVSDICESSSDSVASSCYLNVDPEQNIESRKSLQEIKSKKLKTTVFGMEKNNSRTTHKESVSSRSESSVNLVRSNTNEQRTLSLRPQDHCYSSHSSKKCVAPVSTDMSGLCVIPAGSSSSTPNRSVQVSTNPKIAPRQNEIKIAPIVTVLNSGPFVNPTTTEIPTSVSAVSTTVNSVSAMSPPVTSVSTAYRTLNSVLVMYPPVTSVSAMSAPVTSVPVVYDKTLNSVLAMYPPVTLVSAVSTTVNSVPASSSTVIVSPVTPVSAMSTTVNSVSTSGMSGPSS